MSVVRASGLGALLAARSPTMAPSGSEARPGYDTVGDQPAFRKIVRGVFAHLLVYNLVRGVMAEAAARHEVEPRRLSFQGARQVLEGFRPELAKAAPRQATALRDEALKAIAGERVGGRPDRYEPRARKRREKMYPRLQVPRREARRRLARAG